MFRKIPPKKRDKKMPTIARRESESCPATPDLLFVPEQALRSLAYTALQAPLTSLCQMVAPAYLPKVELIQPPAQVESLSAAWHAQQIGSGLGIALELTAVNCLTKGRARAAVAGWPGFEIGGATKTRLVQNVLKQAGLGACYSGFLQPVSQLAPDRQLESRFSNAAQGAMACGTFSSCQYLSRAPYFQAGLTGRVMRNDVSRSFFCGLPAGFLAESEEVQGKKFESNTWQNSSESIKSRLHNAYAFALGGATLAGAEHGRQRVGKMRVLEEKVQELEMEIMVDPLTKLLNRRGLTQALGREIGVARRDGSTVSLLFGDLDGFKAVNDSLGHHAGDLVLDKVGQELKAHLRESDYCGRLGGDEFLLVLPKMQASEARLLASRLESAVKARFAQDACRVGISLGVASNAQGRKSLELFLEEADQSMYRIKETRKGGRPEDSLI
jgi:diguanylate cyclase (GGDEF)-like protein